MAFNDEMEDESDKVFEALRISIAAQVTRTSVTLQEFIEIQRLNGLSDSAIKNLLFRDLTEGGRIFGEFKRSLDLNITGKMGQLANEAADIRFGREPEKKKIWIAALVNTCPDCLPRHGQIDTSENWELRGEPRSGWSVCRTNCQCILLDAEDAEGREELKEPIIRSKK